MIEHNNCKDEVSNHRRITEWADENKSDYKTNNEIMYSWFDWYRNHLKLPCAIMKVEGKGALFALDQVKEQYVVNDDEDVKVIERYPKTQEQLEKTDEVIVEYDYFIVEAKLAEGVINE